jgi:hypothetical protein
VDEVLVDVLWVEACVPDELQPVNTIAAANTVVNNTLLFFIFLIIILLVSSLFFM